MGHQFSGWRWFWWSREPDGCGFAGVCGYALQPFGCCVRIGSYQRLSGNGLADGNGADAKEADASAGSFAGRKDAYERRTFPFEASKGEPLLYFDSYEALKFFFVQSLKWEDEEDSLLPDLKEFGNFVVFANPKGLLIGPDVAEYFADKRNPLYNAELAEEEAYELFCEEGLCPFDLLKYGMEHDLLPGTVPVWERKGVIAGKLDFVARWFLGEYYEGE